jgi:hypothetical protein
VPTVAVPNLLTDPGYLFAAPLATAEPTNTVAASKFTDAWAAAWVPLGATEDGNTFSYESTVEPIEVAEFFDPIRYSTTGRAGSFAFSLADFVLDRVKLAFNGGTKTLVSGTGATQLTSYVPPTPGAEVRTMLGWESLDGTVRVIVYQAIQGGAVEVANQKAPAKAIIPCTFNFEVPSSGNPWKMYTAGAVRGGA